MKGPLLVTVDVEEWHHSLWFDVNRIPRKITSSYEEDLDVVLNLFRTLNIVATFFVLGEIAERSPEIVRKIANEGHEVACHGYCHKSADELGEKEFLMQTARAKATIEGVLGKRIQGYRAPNFRIDARAANTLEKLGFHYDSSIVPCLRIPGWYGSPCAPTIPYQPSKSDLFKEDESRGFWEVPIAVFPGIRLPGGGGWYLRNIGSAWVRTVLKACLKNGPALVYIHPWETSDNHVHPGVPFHVFRKTGEYVRKAIEGLVKNLRVKSTTIKDFLRKEEY